MVPENEEAVAEEYLQANLNDLVKVYLKNYNKKWDSNF